ncbi:MAG: ROK family protein [Anaerovoracaceae bacterium]|jgi:glucokinase
MYRLGFDIGGTNIGAGVIDEKARIVAKRQIPFPLWEPVRLVCEEMRQMADEMAKELEISTSDFKYAGIAVPGSLDSKKEKVIRAFNLGFYDVPLKSCAMDYFPGLNIFMANDADAAALAELYRGAFRSCNSGVLLTLGTGVGGGLILNGRVYRGGMGHGVELGHMPVNCREGDLCTCGNRGCIETFCSATWIIKRGQEAMDKKEGVFLRHKVKGDRNAMTAKIVIDCAREGDEASWNIFEEYIDNLTCAITGIINLLDPEVIALGGGVSQAGEFLLAPVRERVLEKTFVRYPYKILGAQLGNDGGIIGAALLGEQNLIE